MKLMYLDHAAATPLDPAVRKAMEPFERGSFGNPSSLHRLGREARESVEEARRTVAQVFGVTPRGIVFTGGGSESDNLAMLGLAREHQKHGKHIIISAIEHPAVEEAAHALEQDGFSITRLPVDSAGRLDPKSLAAALRPDTILVSVIYANNEVGTIQPISAFARVIRKWRSAHKTVYPYFHTDAAQAVGYCDVVLQRLGVDLLSCNASKIYGPKGVGVLVMRDGVELAPIVYGGGQERGLRAGTENVAGIVGLAAALQLALKLQVKEVKRLTMLRDAFIKDLQKISRDVVVNGALDDRLPGNVHVSFPGIDGEALVLYLDAKGVAASTGSACATIEREPSRVLVAMGLAPEQVGGSVRFTLGRSTTKVDLKTVVGLIPGILKRLR